MQKIWNIQEISVTFEWNIIANAYLEINYVTYI